MNALRLEERLLVLRHVAALRERGWPSGRALAVVASGLPRSLLRDELQRMSEALQRGDEIQASDDPLLQLLARGEAAGPEVLSDAIAGYELQGGSTDALLPGRTVLMLLGTALGLAGLGAWFSAVSYAELFGPRGELPALTGFIVENATGLALTCLVGFSAALFAVLRPPSWLRRLTGSDLFENASKLRLVAAAVQSGVSESHALSWFDPNRPSTIIESSPVAGDSLLRHATTLVAERDGGAAAARLGAAELESEARVRRARFAAVAPHVVLVIAGAAVGLLLVGFYLPIFSIAGAVN